VFNLVAHVTEAIELWTEHWNDDPKPFVSLDGAHAPGLAWIHRPTTWQDSESSDRHSEGSTGFGLTSSAAIGTCETKSL